MDSGVVRGRGRSRSAGKGGIVNAERKHETESGRRKAWFRVVTGISAAGILWEKKDRQRERGRDEQAIVKDGHCKKREREAYAAAVESLVVFGEEKNRSRANWGKRRKPGTRGACIEAEAGLGGGRSGNHRSEEAGPWEGCGISYRIQMPTANSTVRHITARAWCHPAKVK